MSDEEIKLGELNWPLILVIALVICIVVVIIKFYLLADSYNIIVRNYETLKETCIPAAFVWE